MPVTTKTIQFNSPRHSDTFETFNNTDRLNSNWLDPTASNTNFSAPLNRGLFSEFKGSESSADYWLYKLDGTIVDDGNKDFNVEYLDADGNVQVALDVIRAAKTAGWSQSLIDVLGIDQAKAILAEREIDTEGMSSQEIGEALYTSSGFAWNPEAREWQPTTEGATLSFATSQAMKDRYLQNAADSWVNLSEDLQNEFGGGQNHYAGLMPYYMAIPEIAASGSPAAWLTANLVKVEQFGTSFYAHKELASKLETAFADYDGEMPTYNGAFVPRLIKDQENGNYDLSMHAFGLAIDFNYLTNDMVRGSNKMVMEAIALMNQGSIEAILPEEWNTVSDRLELLGNSNWRAGFLNQYELAQQSLNDTMDPENIANWQFVQEQSDLYKFLNRQDVKDSLDFPNKDARNLGWFAQQGFSNHPVDLVYSMQDAGFHWLMDNQLPGIIYDSMHFELKEEITYVF
jgi:hypothetical protein